MIYRCKNCDYKTWIKRARCPKCGAIEFDEIQGDDKGYLLVSWKLTATPDGFEDVYWLCLININGTKVFCRSLKEPKGVMIIKDNGICEPM